MTRILVADDHQIVRAGLKNLLSEYKEFTVAGEAGSGTDALKMVRESDWDVVLLDISMPDMNGIDTLKQIKRSKPDLPVLILTMHPEDHYAINLLRAGANGYVCKECAPEQLVGAIRTVASGRRYVSPGARRSAGRRLERRRPERAAHGALGTRVPGFLQTGRRPGGVRDRGRAS